MPLTDLINFFHGLGVDNSGKNLMNILTENIVAREMHILTKRLIRKYNPL